VPTWAAVAVQERMGALLGCACGLPCAFAIALGPAGGPRPAWPIFIAATFDSAAFIGFGKAPMLAVSAPWRPRALDRSDAVRRHPAGRAHQLWAERVVDTAVGGSLPTQ